MEQSIGEIGVKAVVSLILIETLDFLNVGKTMNDRQVAQTVDLILEDYSVYKIDYFVLFFNRVKKGHFGKLYDRVDGQVLLDWLRQFDLDYQLDIEQERINEKKRIEKDVSLSEFDRPTPMPDYVKDMIKKVVPPIKEVTERPKTENQKLVDQVISEFDALHKDQDDFSGGKRYVKYNGKMMDVSEYIHERILEL